MARQYETSSPACSKHRRPRWRMTWRQPVPAGDALRRYGRRWTDDEIQLVADWLLTLSPQTIALRLGRTLRGLEDICRKRHLAATRQTHVTSSEASRVT